MHANMPRPDSSGRKVRHDQRDVPDAGDHRVVLVDGTLVDRGTGMGVDIRDDGELLRFADVPKLAERVSVDFDVPAQASWVQVVEVLDMSDAA